MAECTVDDDGDVTWRERKWVPANEQLRTRILQEVHNNIMSGHPGRANTYVS